MFAMQPRRPSSRATALALAALLLAPVAALATSPEDDYLAARERDSAELDKLSAPEDRAARDALKDKDTRDLVRRLGAMTGPFALAGYPAEGRLNPELASPNEPLGNLDGLAFQGPDEVHAGDAGAALVTTDGLLDRWLRHPTRQFQDGDTRAKIALPRAAAAAVATAGFYTLALGHISPAVARYAILPVPAPPGAKFATAMLATTDIGPEIPATPDRLFVALEKSGRVFLVSASPATPIPAIAACDAVLSAYDGKADAAEKAFNRAGDLNPAVEARVEKRVAKLRDQGQAAFLACFEDRIKSTPAFSAATRQATAIVEGLARN
jgi:hypothetical protein